MPTQPLNQPGSGPGSTVSSVHSVTNTHIPTHNKTHIQAHTPMPIDSYTPIHSHTPSAVPPKRKRGRPRTCGLEERPVKVAKDGPKTGTNNSGLSPTSSNHTTANTPNLTHYRSRSHSHSQPPPVHTIGLKSYSMDTNNQQPPSISLPNSLSQQQVQDQPASLSPTDRVFMIQPSIVVTPSGAVPLLKPTKPSNKTCIKKTANTKTGTTKLATSKNSTKNVTKPANKSSNQSVAKEHRKQQKEDVIASGNNSGSGIVSSGSSSSNASEKYQFAKSENKSGFEDSTNISAMNSSSSSSFSSHSLPKQSSFLSQIDNSSPVDPLSNQTAKECDLNLSPTLTVPHLSSSSLNTSPIHLKKNGAFDNKNGVTVNSQKTDNRVENRNEVADLQHGIVDNNHSRHASCGDDPKNGLQNSKPKSSSRISVLQLLADDPPESACSNSENGGSDGNNVSNSNHSNNNNNNTNTNNNSSSNNNTSDTNNTRFPQSENKARKPHFSVGIVQMLAESEDQLANHVSHHTHSHSHSHTHGHPHHNHHISSVVPIPIKRSNSITNFVNDSNALFGTTKSFTQPHSSFTHSHSFTQPYSSNLASLQHLHHYHIRRFPSLTAQSSHSRQPNSGSTSPHSTHIGMSSNDNGNVNNGGGFHSSRLSAQHGNKSLTHSPQQSSLRKFSNTPSSLSINSNNNNNSNNNMTSSLYSASISTSHFEKPSSSATTTITTTINSNTPIVEFQNYQIPSTLPLFSITSSGNNSGKGNLNGRIKGIGSSNPNELTLDDPYFLLASTKSKYMTGYAREQKGENKLGKSNPWGDDQVNNSGTGSGSSTGNNSIASGSHHSHNQTPLQAALTSTINSTSSVTSSAASGPPKKYQPIEIFQGFPGLGGFSGHGLPHQVSLRSFSAATSFYQAPPESAASNGKAMLNGTTDSLKNLKSSKNPMNSISPKLGSKLGSKLALSSSSSSSPLNSKLSSPLSSKLNSRLGSPLSMKMSSKEGSFGHAQRNGSSGPNRLNVLSVSNGPKGSGGLDGAKEDQTSLEIEKKDADQGVVNEKREKATVGGTTVNNTTATVSSSTSIDTNGNTRGNTNSTTISEGNSDTDANFNCYTNDKGNTASPAKNENVKLGRISVNQLLG